MKTVWKFPLSGPWRSEVVAPRGADALHFDVQDGVLCLWAAVDPGEERITYTFHVVGTGQPIPPQCVNERGQVLSIGSCIDGNLVWHLFEEWK